MKTTFVPFGRLAELRDKPGADLILLKPGAGIFSDVKLIHFPTRFALESFNKKAGLRPLVYSEVAKGMAIHKHEREAASQ